MFETFDYLTGYNKINDLIYGSNFNDDEIVKRSKNHLIANKPNEILPGPQLQTQTLKPIDGLLKLFKEYKQDSESSDSALHRFKEVISYFFHKADSVASK